MARPVGWAPGSRRGAAMAAVVEHLSVVALGERFRAASRPLGTASPGDLVAGEGSRRDRGGGDDRLRGAVDREVAGALQRRRSGRAWRPAAAQWAPPHDPDAGAARRVAAPLGGATAGWRLVDQPQGRGMDGRGAGLGGGGGPAREALQAIGWSIQMPRPEHPARATPDAQEAFKKSSRLPSARRRRNIRARPSRSSPWTSTASG